MSHDYKDSIPPAESSSSLRLPPWLWFLLGLLLGVGGTVLVYVKLGPKLPGAHQLAAEKCPPVIPAQPVKPEPVDSGYAKPRFEFYSILPEQEVMVSDEEMQRQEKQAQKPTLPPQPGQPQPKAADTQQTHPQPRTQVQTQVPVSPSPTPMQQAQVTKPENYVIQMGAFGRAEDAERLRAKLALMGIETEVQRVTINNKDTFHRVRAGPFNNAKKVNDIRARLIQNQIQSMVVKLTP